MNNEDTGIPERAGAAWSTKEDKDLLDAWLYKGRCLASLAKMHRRSLGSILSRLKLLEVLKVHIPSNMVDGNETIKDIGDGVHFALGKPPTLGNRIYKYNGPLTAACKQQQYEEVTVIKLKVDAEEAATQIKNQIEEEKAMNKQKALVMAVNLAFGGRFIEVTGSHGTKKLLKGYDDYKVGQFVFCLDTHGGIQGVQVLQVHEQIPTALIETAVSYVVPNGDLAEYDALVLKEQLALKPLKVMQDKYERHLKTIEVEESLGLDTSKLQGKELEAQKALTLQFLKASLSTNELDKARKAEAEVLEKVAAEFQGTETAKSLEAVTEFTKELRTLLDSAFGTLKGEQNEQL